MIANMNAWVRDGVAPPPSAYPHIADGTLVPLDKLAFPAIPGVHPPQNFNEAFPLDFGPNWQSTGILAIQPPRVGTPYNVLVPQVDADGTDRAGIHLPEITVPLATYTGWNSPRSRHRRARTSAHPSSAPIFPSRRPRKSARLTAIPAPPSKNATQPATNI